MKKILVIHGAGMDMRGKFAIETFGPMKLPEYDEKIRAYAAELGVAVDVFHSNTEGAVIDRLYAAHDANYDGAIINPAGFTRGYPALNAAITAAFSADGRRPCTNPTFSPFSCALSAAWVSIAVCRSPSLDSSITGHTQ